MFHKDFPNICFDMFAVWWIKTYYFPLARIFIYMLILIFEFLIITTLFQGNIYVYIYIYLYIYMCYVYLLGRTHTIETFHSNNNDPYNDLLEKHCI